MNKIIFCLLMLLISAPSVLANTEYLNWGFGHHILGLAERDRLWGSTIGQGSLPSSNVSITISSVDLPHVIDLDGDGTNEIFFYTSTGIRMYDARGTFLANYPVSKLFKRAAGASYNGTNHLYALIRNTDDDWYIDVIKKSGSSLVLQARLNITDANYSGFIFSSINLYVPDINMNISIFEKNSSTLLNRITSPNGSSLIYAGGAGGLNQTFFNPLIVADYNGDGYDEIAFVYKKGTTARASVYDTASSSFIADDVQVSAVNPANTANIMAGSIGAADSFPTIIISTTDTTNGDIRAFDFALNQLFDTGTGGTGAYPYTMINDIDSDGLNEFCYFFSISITCLNALFTASETIPQSMIPSLAGDGQFSTGRYSRSDYVDIISGASTAINGGIYRRNATNTSKWHKTYGMPANTLYAIPVSVLSRTNQVLDILAVGKSSATIMFSDQVAATCGNGICNSGENMITCPADCELVSPTQAVLTEISINPCNTVIWLKNTTVQVMAKAESSDSADVNISAVIYGGTTAEQRASSGFVSSGTTATFNFIANTSCSGCSIGVSAYTVSAPAIDSQSFSFSVNDISGVSFGSSSCGITQPLEQVLANANITGSSDNAITGSVNLFAGLTGLSALLIYIFVMFVVGIGCFVFGLYMHMEGKLVFMITMFLEVLMLIFGSLPPLSIIPIGVIIVLVLVLVVIIAVWLRGIFTGSSDGNQGGQ